MQFEDTKDIFGAGCTNENQNMTSASHLKRDTQSFVLATNRAEGPKARRIFCF
jgi:hypothetical protein